MRRRELFRVACADILSRAGDLAPAQPLDVDAVGIAHASTSFDFAHRTLSALTELGGGNMPVIGLSNRLSLRDSVLNCAS